MVNISVLCFSRRSEVVKLPIKYKSNVHVPEGKDNTHTQKKFYLIFIH